MAVEDQARRDQSWKLSQASSLVASMAACARAIAAACCVVSHLVARRLRAIYYIKYQRIVDERLKQPLFTNTAKIYAEPREVRPGQKLRAQLIANELRQAGYTVGRAVNRLADGHLSARATQSITVHPGPQSYHAPGQRHHPCRAAAWWIPSPTTTDSRWPAMSWSRC